MRFAHLVQLIMLFIVTRYVSVEVYVSLDLKLVSIHEAGKKREDKIMLGIDF